MKPTMKNLSVRGIHNPHGLAALQDPPRVYLAYRNQSTGRWYQSAAWQITSADSEETDPAANNTRAWYDHGLKTFSMTGALQSIVGQREPLRRQALDWIAERYSIDIEWERSVFGSWHPLGTLARAMALPDDWKPEPYEPYEPPRVFREIEHHGYHGQVRADGRVSSMSMMQMGPTVANHAAELREYSKYIRLIWEACEDALAAREKAS